MARAGPSRPRRYRGGIGVLPVRVQILIPFVRAFLPADMLQARATRIGVWY
jgi:hypothetical protein